MPNIRQLATLFRALSQKDLVFADHVAKQIANVEEEKGHHSAAQLLRASLHQNGIKGHRVIEPINGTLSNGNFLETALTRGRATTCLQDVRLRPQSRKQLEEFVNESRHADYLTLKGVRRRTKLLFVGPPGCGKSFTAQAIANELELPLFNVRFDAVIGAYLGQTAIHLRELFRFVSVQPCVLLFDEIDALGKQRGNPLDVGELDRIVIALMQELEFLETQGIVVATSNLPKNLDRALWRRFDLVLQFPSPTPSEISAYAKEVALRFGLKKNALGRRSSAHLKNYADAEKYIEAEARRRALQELKP
jgi:SpoVK/Ycf46/Vps4 family AAA+-type ATPase